MDDRAERREEACCRDEGRVSSSGSRRRGRSIEGDEDRIIAIVVKNC